MTAKLLDMHKTEESVKKAKELMEAGKTAEAIHLLDETLCVSDISQADELYYLRGNAYRKQGNWQLALNSYLEAIALNPKSPAVHARAMIMNILEFYNKDMYNQ